VLTSDILFSWNQCLSNILLVFFCIVFAIVSFHNILCYAWLSNSQWEQQNIKLPSCKITDKCDLHGYAKNHITLDMFHDTVYIDV
jgi:hypothetical protein